MWKVVLKRGPLEDRIYQHRWRARALVRAQDLAELHSCDYVESRDGWVVDASEYYAGKE